MAFTPRVFSGIQPSGDLHLGNYLGAIKRFVPLQQTHECLYCVVDMHAITVWQEPETLRRTTREVAAAYIAAGVDPKQHIVFNQSRVRQHAELAWVFNCVARMGWMARMTPNPRPLTVWDDRARAPLTLEIRADPIAPSGMLAEELRCFCRRKL